MFNYTKLVATAVAENKGDGMHHVRRPLGLTSLMILPMLLCVTPALAQNKPSSDEIIKSLMPSGNLMGAGARGITLRPAGQPEPNGAAAPAQSARAPATIQPPAVICSTVTGVPSKDLTVKFATGSPELTPEAMQTLDELGTALTSQQLSQFRFRVEGHTDTVGSKSYNKALSGRRALAVVNYVERKFAINPVRLESAGMGSECLKVSTPDQTPNPENRRVTVINLGN
jgi:OOP family OmpA-OmpF porin